VTDRVISVRLQLEVDRANRSAKSFGGTIQGVATAADKSAGSMTRLGTSAKGVGTAVAKGAGAATTSIGGLNSRLGTVGTSLKGIAALGVAIGAVSMFKTVIDEAREAERTTRQTEAVIRSTGGAAHVTADQVSGLADKLSAKTAVDDEVVAHGENVLLTFKNIRNEAGRGNDIFNQTTAVALDMSAALSESGDASEGLQSNSVRLGKALNDPIAGISALTRVGVTFTAKQKEQVKSLVESGDIMSAQKMILSELTSEFGGMAGASADATGKAEVGWKNFAEAVGMKVLPAVNAVSNWATNTGLPALGHVADAVGDVVIPAFHGLVSAGQGVVGFWQSLPAPIQAGAIALGAWALVGDKVTGFLGRASGPMKAFSDELKLQQGLASLAGQDVGRFGASLAVLESRVPAIGKMGDAFRTAKGDASGFGSTLKGVALAGVSGLKSAAGGLVGLLGGPWGLALGGATVLLTAMMAQSDKAAAEQQKLADAGKSVAQAIADQNGVINASVRQKAAQAAEDAGLLAGMDRIGISTTRVTDAVAGQKGAYAGLSTQLDGYIMRHSHVESSESGAVTVFDQEGAAAIGLRDKLKEVVGAKDGELGATKRVTEATAETIPVMGGAATATGFLQSAIEGAGEEYDKAATDADKLRTAIDLLTKQQIAEIDTLEGYEAAQDSLDAAVKQNGRTLDIHTEAGRKNRDALEDVAAKSRDLMQADIDSGMPMNQALARHNARIAALKEEAIKTFGAKSQAVNLINTYGKIPKAVTTQITVRGYTAANNAMLSLSAKQTLLAKGLPISASNLRQINQEKNRQKSGGYAGGGLLRGPGTPTSDDIPLWGSRDEFMQQASAVRYYGVPFMEAVNQKRFPKAMAQGQEGVPALGYQRGGQVWPFPVDVSKTKIPEFIPAGMGGGGNVQRWAPLVLQALAMLGQSSALLPLVLRRMNQESGGNPNAINLTDINAQRGYPSQGLMQTIPGTFAAYAGRFASRGITDPFANIYAGLNYAIHRYGSLAYAMNKPGGYALGGLVKGGDGAGLAGLADFMRGTYARGVDKVPMDGMYRLHRGERVTAAGHNRAVDVHLTVHGDGTKAADFVVDALHKADANGRVHLRTG
jgi:Transglycosylase SLT domain